VLMFALGNALGRDLLLPSRQDCSPTLETCRKGDFVDKRIADCEYSRLRHILGTCTARGNSGGIISWVVAPDAENRCVPIEGKQIRCGDPGTNTRCVCSDYKIKPNQCRCQYWTADTPGKHLPAFCTVYYLGGTSGVHQYACCNNCNDTTPNTCDGHTYQGGSTTKYCGPCGKVTGGGLVKYLFNCGSCSNQAHCEDVCNKRVGTLPGLCWKWVDCFKGCCVAMTDARSRISGHSAYALNMMEVEFCGDAQCTGSETPASCPGDCYQRQVL